MNKHAVFHKPESNYAYATAADTVTVVLRVAQSDKFDRIEILYNNKYDFTQTRFTREAFKCASDGVDRKSVV